MHSLTQSGEQFSSPKVKLCVCEWKLKRLYITILVCEKTFVDRSATELI